MILQVGFEREESLLTNPAKDKSKSSVAAASAPHTLPGERTRGSQAATPESAPLGCKLKAFLRTKPV